MRRHAAATVLAVAALATLCGCGSGSSGGNASASSAPTTRQVDEKLNGHTIDVHLGDTVTVVLHSTYWSLDVPATTLQPLGAPQSSPSACPVAGSGCGTLTQSYNASHVGQATLHAHRDSCGEARRCTASESDWSLTVRVS